MRCAGGALRRLPQPPHRPRPSRRGLCPDRGPGGGQEARPEIRGAPRSGPPRHPRHDHRGPPARPVTGEHPPGSRPPQVLGIRLRLRHRRRGHFHRPVLPERGSRRRAGCCHRPPRSARDRAFRGDPLRSVAVRALARRESPGHAPGAGGARTRLGGAADQGTVRRLDPRRVRAIRAGRTRRRRRGPALYRAHADRRAARSVAADAGDERGDAGHRCGDTRQSRTHPNPLRRAHRQPARRHRPHGVGHWR